MDGDGREDLVLYRDGLWYVSATPRRHRDRDSMVSAAPGDIPLLGDVNGTGVKGPVRLPERLSGTGRRTRDGVVDKIYGFGGVPGDIPMMFDYDGDGKDDLVIYRNGTWYISTDGGVQLSAAIFGYGLAGDTPLYAGAGAVSTTYLDATRFLSHASFGPIGAEITAAAGAANAQHGALLQHLHRRAVREAGDDIAGDGLRSRKTSRAIARAR